MKIGLLTLHNSDNFGSVLQAFATNKFLNNSGYDCEIIDLLKPEVVKLYSLFKPPVNKANLASDCYNLTNIFSLLKRKKMFSIFRKENIKMTEKQFFCYDEVKNNVSAYDALIVGSDQVWNTGICDFDNSYFLDFDVSAKKIAYAASFGPKSIDVSEVHLSEKLKSFFLVTVRESIANEILKKASCNPAERVLDPVFLLSREQWRSFSADFALKEKYMLCYFAGGVTPEFEKFTLNFAKQRGLRRVFITPEWKNFFKTGRKLYSIGPAEFLSLIDNADIVCTNSFHATAFSIIMNKQFVVGTYGEKTDDRINTVLSDFNLTFCEYGSSYTEKQIDYVAVNRLLSAKAERCRAILLNALEE